MRSVLQVLSFDVLSKLILGGLGIILIRYMPADQYAEYTFALSLAAFVTQSVSATFNRVYILSSDEAVKSGNEWTVLGLQASIISALVVLGMPLTLSIGNSYWLIVMLILANCASEFSKTYYQRDMKFYHFSMIELSRSMLFFFGALVLISLLGADVSSDAVVSIQAASLSIVAWWALAKTKGKWKSTSLPNVLRYGMTLADGRYTYLFAYFFVVGVFTQTDIFMLRIIGDDTMIATYGSAFRYYSILSLALGAIHAVLLPMLQRTMNHRDLKIVFSKHRKILVIFATGTALAAWLAQWVIPWVDAGKYPEATATFRVLCVSAVISFAFSPHVNLLMRFERFGFLLSLVLAALVLHVSTSAFLIPTLGPVGAAISTLISSATITFSIYLQSRKLIESSEASEKLDP